MSTMKVGNSVWPRCPVIWALAGDESDPRARSWAAGVPIEADALPFLSCEQCGRMGVERNGFVPIYAFDWTGIDYSLLLCEECATDEDWIVVK